MKRTVDRTVLRGPDRSDEAKEEEEDTQVENELRKETSSAHKLCTMNEDEEREKDENSHACGRETEDEGAGA